MINFAIYAVFVVVCGFIAAGIGYLTNASYPGIGDIAMVAAFTVLLWPAWTLALRITERYWPDKEEEIA